MMFQKTKNRRNFPLGGLKMIFLLHNSTSDRVCVTLATRLLVSSATKPAKQVSLLATENLIVNKY